MMQKSSAFSQLYKQWKLASSKVNELQTKSISAVALTIDV
jgi:hypothetical protein